MTEEKFRRKLRERLENIETLIPTVPEHERAQIAAVAGALKRMAVGIRIDSPEAQALFGECKKVAMLITSAMAPYGLGLGPDARTIVETAAADLFPHAPNARALLGDV